MSLSLLKKDFTKHADPKRAQSSMWFFKTGRGEYGEGDVFIGLTMGEQRAIAKKYNDLRFTEIQQLLNSKIHEERMVGLLILVYQFEKGDVAQKKKVYDFYYRNRARVNNWDLVDVTCHKIVGAWLMDKSHAPLYTLARSKSLWDKRIAVVSTFAFIRNGEFNDVLGIAELLLNDPHDLIHKAVGWMLREVGKKSTSTLELFLKKHYSTMPRTMLRYAIEKFPEQRRRAYLKGMV